MKPIIEISRLCKNYGKHRAVNQLDLSIQQGEIYGLLGPNGAGKSTTILMLMGLSEPDSGSVSIDGIDAKRQPLLIRKKVGFLPENVAFYEDMSALENLIFTCRLNGITRDQAMQVSQFLLDKVGLEGRGQQKVSTFSRGMRQRLGLADCLVKDPRVIILDEPTLGLDPIGVAELLELIKDLNEKEGITVLLSSHHLHEVQKICHRVGIFVEGQKLAEGTINSLADQLFGPQSFTLELEAYSADNELITPEQIKLLTKGQYEILKVLEKSGSLLLTMSQENVSGIAKLLIEHGYRLEKLLPIKPGLDEIYQRYFQDHPQPLYA